jgi:oxaloacetate decarboxylase alpha subunit
LRLVLPEELVDTMLAAGAAPHWPAGGATRTRKAVTSRDEFVSAAHELPNWKYLAVNFAGERVELHRAENEGTS